MFHVCENPYDIRYLETRLMPAKAGKAQFDTILAEESRNKVLEPTPFDYRK